MRPAGADVRMPASRGEPGQDSAGASPRGVAGMARLAQAASEHHGDRLEAQALAAWRPRAAAASPSGSCTSAFTSLSTIEERTCVMPGSRNSVSCRKRS